MLKTISVGPNKDPRNPLNLNKIFPNTSHNPLKRIHFGTTTKSRPLPTTRICRRNPKTSKTTNNRGNVWNKRMGEC